MIFFPFFNLDHLYEFINQHILMQEVICTSVFREFIHPFFIFVSESACFSAKLEPQETSNDHDF